MTNPFKNSLILYRLLLCNWKENLGSYDDEQFNYKSSENPPGPVQEGSEASRDKKYVTHIVNTFSLKIQNMIFEEVNAFFWCDRR